MVDFTNIAGKMCDWDHVEAVEGAYEVLQALSQHAKIYIATGAAVSTEADIKKAFDRVQLGQFIHGYFCYDNLGIAKGTAEFYPAIIDKLATSAVNIAMVGDSLMKDIIPASQAGIKTYWLNPSAADEVPEGTTIINSLTELAFNSSDQLR